VKLELKIYLLGIAELILYALRAQLYDLLEDRLFRLKLAQQLVVEPHSGWAAASLTRIQLNANAVLAGAV